MIEQETKDLIDKLLLEKQPLAGIARVTGVSERWLQTYVNTLYRLIPKDVEVWPKKTRTAKLAEKQCKLASGKY